MLIPCCYLLYFKQIKQSKFEIIKGLLCGFTHRVSKKNMGTEFDVLNLHK